MKPDLIVKPGDVKAAVIKRNAEVKRRLSRENKTVPCPFPVRNFDPTEKTARLERVDCPYGPDTSWCGICTVHNKWRQQQGMNKQMYIAKKLHRMKKMNETGLAPQLWKKPRPIVVKRPWEIKTGDLM